MSASIAKSELRIQQLTEDKNKNLRVMSTLLNEGKEDSTEYKRLEAAVADAESDISALRTILANPNFRAIAEKQEQEQQERVNQQLTGAVVTAVKDAIPTPAVIAEMATEDRAAVIAGYRSFLKDGRLPETRDVTQTGSGIALVPAGFESTYQSALKVVSPLAATVQGTEASRITKLFSVSDVSSDQRLLGESSNVGASADPLFVSYQATNTDSGVSVVKVSWQLLQDSAFNMENFISVVTKGRVASFYDAAILRNTDPSGTTLPNSVAGGLLAAVTSGVVQAGSAGSLATGWKYTDAVALVNSISDVAYNADAAFLVSPKMRAFILTNFLDSQNRPLYTFDDSGNLFVLGKPVWTSNYFPTYGASTVQALYGRFDLSFAYQYANRIYSANPLPEQMMTEFVVETRYAGSPTQIAANALVKLTTSAS